MRNMMRKVIIVLCILHVSVLCLVLYQTVQKNPYDISKIELRYYGCWADPLIIKDQGTISNLMHYMLMAQGEKEDNPELTYGGGKALTIYYVNGDTFNFTLLDRGTYTTPEVTDEGYYCIYYADISEMYDYVMQLISERKTQ